MTPGLNDVNAGQRFRSARIGTLMRRENGVPRPVKLVFQFGFSGELLSGEDARPALPFCVICR